VNDICPYIGDCIKFAQDVCSGNADTNTYNNCEKCRDWIDNNMKYPITLSEIKEAEREKG
jgi:hypothetical protein